LSNGAAHLATVTARIVQDNTGSCLELPILLTETGPVEPLLRYQLLFYQKSRSWHLKLCQAVRLLWEYAEANSGLFEEPRDLFAAFGVKLMAGTFGPEGLDPSGLYWLPRQPENVRKLVGQLAGFSHWLAGEHGGSEIAPWREASTPERVLAAAGWARRNAASFLGHTASRARAEEQMRWTPYLPRPQLPALLAQEVVRFPADRFGDLLFDGFLRTRRGVEQSLGHNLRDVLITLMLHGAGVRISECFHLWVEDVQEYPLDSTIAWVRIGHPTHGLTQWWDGGKGVEGTRAEYLATHGLTPRTMLGGKVHAGWKNPALDGKWYLELHWSEPDYGRLFLRLWKLYLRYLLALPRRHPYAWVTFDSATPGQLYTISMFMEAHATAVRRIGLVPRRVNGTTPHGHRHDYGQRLADAGVSAVVLRKCLHHASVSSQLVYTQPDRERINRELAAARVSMDAGAKLDLAQICRRWREDMSLLERGEL